MIDPSFQEVKRLFVLSYEDIGQQTSCNQHFLPAVEMKDYNVITDRRHFFHEPVDSNIRTYDIQMITTGQGDNYTTSCILDYHPYFTETL